MTSNQDQRKEHGKDWQNLARLASREQDPEKLMELIRQLNSALENEGKNEGIDPAVPGPVDPSLSSTGSGKLARVA
jgi:hypothetical protein